MKTIVKPLGREQQKIVERLGRDHYTYDGVPEKGKVAVGLVHIDVWYFDFNKFEVDTQIVMATQYAKVHSCQFSEALQWLKTHPSAIPCDQIEIEVQP